MPLQTMLPIAIKMVLSLWSFFIAPAVVARTLVTINSANPAALPYERLITPMTQKFNLTSDLYDYQAVDATKMLSAGNWLNFSEMGTGKTPEALAVVEMGNFLCPLIVCPSSLRFEWTRQIDDWTGQKAALPNSNTYTRLEPLVRSFLEGVKYKIINYEVLRSDDNLEVLNQIPFDVLIFDEVHKLRNPKTQVVKGAWKFLDAHPTAKVIAMSGSPIMNYPNDLYVPLSLVQVDKYPRTHRDWLRFSQHYCLWTSGQHGRYIYGVRYMDYLKKETEPFSIRRTKKEVLPFLPDKYYRRVILEMDKDQRDLYTQMETELLILLDSGESLWSPDARSKITRLRQLNLDPKILGVSASSAKTDFLVDLVESTNEKVVIFSCFERYIYLLSLLLQQYNPVVISGTISPQDRQLAVSKFQEQDDVRICLGTIQSMGEGVTLTAASNVVLVDRWWNEPTNQQAVDRLHRIGQKNAVQVIYPVCEDSVDTLLDEILARKSGALHRFLDETQVTNAIVEEIRRRHA